MIVYDGSQIRGVSYEKELSYQLENVDNRKKKFFGSLRDKLTKLFQNDSFKDLTSLLIKDNRTFNLNVDFLAYAIFVYVQVIEAEKNKRAKSKKQFEIDNRIFYEGIDLLKFKGISDTDDPEFKVTLLRYLRYILRFEKVYLENTK